MKYTELLMGDRIRVMQESKDITLIYDLLEKHLSASIDNIRNKYKLTGDFMRNTMTVEGSLEDIYYLFNYLLRFGLKFESVQSDKFRVDLYEFIGKIL